MKLYKVKSSNIEAVGQICNPKKNIELIVSFKSGTSYKYKGVSIEKFNHFIKSESKGKFFLKEIKGKYDSEKINLNGRKKRVENLWEVECELCGQHYLSNTAMLAPDLKTPGIFLGDIWVCHNCLSL